MKGFPMTNPTGSALRARYDQYSAAFTKAGITPLSYDLWIIALSHNPYHISDIQFDHDTERREGWGHDHS